MHGKTEDVNSAKVLDGMFLHLTQRKERRWYKEYGLFGDFFGSQGKFGKS